MDIIKLVPSSDAPYQKMYTSLFNAVTTALEMMEDAQFMKARALLMQAQQETEELYIEGNEEARGRYPLAFSAVEERRQN